MHAVVNHLYLNVPVESIRQAAEESLLQLFSELPGFREFDVVKAADDHLTYSYFGIVWKVQTMEPV